MLKKKSNKPTSFAKKTISNGILIASGVAFFIGGLAFYSDDADAKRKRYRKSKKKITSVVRKPELPLVISISLRRQRLEVYEGDRLIRKSTISSGRSGNRTPKGIFSIIQKNRHHYSNLYNSAPMPFMQRITWSGIALHQGHVPGYPASHGCIRLPYSTASSLFRMTNMGTRVIVANQNYRPRMFSHEALFKPLPFDETPAASTAADGAAKQGEELQTAANADNGASAGRNAPASGGSMSMTSLVGVSPANASEAASGKKLAARAPASSSSTPGSKMFSGRMTRSQLKAAREARMVELKLTVATDQEALKAAREVVAAKRLALRDAGKTVTMAKSHLRNLKRQVAKAKRKVDRITKSIVKFEQRYSNKTYDSVTDERILAKAAAQEDALEAKYFAAVEELEVATSDLSDLEQGIIMSKEEVAGAKAELLAVNKVARQKFITYNKHKQELTKAKRAEKVRGKPIAIFISRRTGKLYIRQGYAPIYSTPVTFEEPDRPIGTHVFTALRFNNGKTDLVWSVISTSDSGRRNSRRRRGKKAERVSYPKSSAAESLARIQIPEDARYKIAQLIKPGSSLIISDRRTSNETGKYTDFIVSLN